MRGWLYTNRWYFFVGLFMFGYFQIVTTFSVVDNMKEHMYSKDGKFVRLNFYYS